jgi:hypothetical protein
MNKYRVVLTTELEIEIESENGQDAIDKAEELVFGEDEILAIDGVSLDFPNTKLYLRYPKVGEVSPIGP